VFTPTDTFRRFHSIKLKSSLGILLEFDKIVKNNLTYWLTTGTFKKYLFTTPSSYDKYLRDYMVIIPP